MIIWSAARGVSILVMILVTYTYGSYNTRLEGPESETCDPPAGPRGALLAVSLIDLR